MRYKITINTSAYKCARCSKKNWEPGTKNDYMIAINGRTFVEKSLREVGWLLEMFRGNTHITDEWTEENSDKVGKYGEYYGMSDRYYNWLHRKAHKVVYQDRLCDITRRQWLSGYGWMQGYFDKQRVIDELMKNGNVKVPFKWLYDIRQYDKNMDGCYMQIEAIN